MRNIPWSDDSRITGAEESNFTTARIQLHPEGCTRQARALFTAAHEKQNSAATSGAALLYPLIWAGAAAQDDMLARHTRLFGYAPRHPGTGGWKVEEGNVVSTIYGPSYDPMIPTYNASTPAGALLEGLHSTQLEMQFEHSGLRSVIRWKTGN